MENVVQIFFHGAKNNGLENVLSKKKYLDMEKKSEGQKYALKYGKCGANFFQKAKICAKYALFPKSRKYALNMR